MNPLKHLFFGTIFSLFCFLLFPEIGLIGFLIIISSSFLIDVDHYIYYFYKKKDFNLKNAYKWFIKERNEFLALSREQRNKSHGRIFFLHGIEVLFVLFVLSFISKYFLFVFIGFAFHLLLDSVHQITYWDRIDKFCLAHDFLKFKKLRFIEENGKK